MFHQSFIGFCKFVQNTLFRTNNIQLEDLQRRLMDPGLIARGAGERQTGDFQSVYICANFFSRFFLVTLFLNCTVAPPQRVTLLARAGQT